MLKINMIHIIKKAFFLLFLIMVATPASAQIELNITKGVVEPLRIAVSPFYAADTQSNNMASQVPLILTSNLERSGLFKAVNPQAFAQNPGSIETSGVRFPEWRATAAQFLITGKVSQTANGPRIEFRLWDVLSEKQLTGTAFTTTRQNWRRIAHIISDQIYKRITGEEGYFDSRIVYISETGPPQKRIKRLAIMDQDSANHKYLTDGRNLVLTPRFSPTEQKITYMEFTRSGAKVYLYNLQTGQRENIGNFKGISFAPRFSPDGRGLIMSIATNGNTDIYSYDIDSKRLNKITSNRAIDTAPSYSPDGRQIVFESDRGGTQQLYTMSSSGSGLHRITFGKGRYANPVWSPRGDLIAFTRMYKGKFYIGVIRPDGSGERLITTAYHVEGPSWSPNGRVLTYFKETSSSGSKQARLYTVDITGFNEKWLKTPRDGSDPAWSPLNK